MDWILWTFTVISAGGLHKGHFRLQNPFAVVTIDSVESHATAADKRALSPYWNESFDMYASTFYSNVFIPAASPLTH